MLKEINCSIVRGGGANHSLLAESAHLNFHDSSNIKTPIQNSRKNFPILLSVVVPCYNEALNLQNFYNAVSSIIKEIKSQITKELNYEFIFVNDGSKDDTLNEIKQIRNNDCNVHFIDFSRNFGKEAAMLAGLQKANGNCVAIMDADLQHPPKMLFSMFEKWFNNEADVVYAKRVSRDGDGFFRAIFSDGFYWLNNVISSVKMESGISDFRLMDTMVVNAILEMREYHRFSKAQFEWVGFRKLGLPYEYVQRLAGNSKWNFWTLFKYAIEGLISFSTMPLRVAFILGICFSVLGLGYGGYIAISALLFGSGVPGYPSLFCAISFFGGIQLIILGVIGEYNC